MPHSFFIPGLYICDPHGRLVLPFRQGSNGPDNVGRISKTIFYNNLLVLDFNAVVMGSELNLDLQLQGNY